MFKKIYIENFKILRQLNIELSKLNLFTGVNSSGKSSFIQSLLLIKENFESKEEFLKILLNASNLPQDIIIKSIMNKLKINNRYLDLGIASNLLYEDAEDDNIKISLEFEDGKVDFICNLKENKEEEVIDCAMNFNGEILNMFKKDNFTYLSADRIVPKSSYEYSKESITKGYLGKNGEYTAHYLAEYKNNEIGISQLKHESASSTQLLENTSAWLSKISKGIDISAEVNVNLQNSSLKYSYGSKIMLPQNVGFGVTYVLPIIVAILKSKPGDTLIIENPESHLHPSGQVEMARLCSKAANLGVQVIIETHSDHFLNGIRVAIKESCIENNDVKIYYFSKDKSELNKTNVQEIQVDSNGKINTWPEGFFDEWEIQLEKLLW